MSGWLRVFRARVLGVFGSRRREADLRREISAHLDEAADEFERQGMPADQARRRALAQFGGVTQTIEAHRERRGFSFFSALRQDLSVRTREIGIRLAFGAHSTNVRALVVREGLLLTAVGLAAGLAAALLATPVLQSQLVNLPATDPVTFAGVSILLIVIALVASYLPARRATRIDPIATLRAE